MPVYPKVIFPFLSNSAVDAFLFSLERVKLQGNKNNLGRKLSSLLSSDGDCRKVEELDSAHEILRMLIDLVSIWFKCPERVRLMGLHPRADHGLLSFLLATQVNDKEEALAHQRKVSYMLARAAEAREAGLGQDRGDTAGRCHLGAQSPLDAPCTDSHRLPAPSCAPALRLRGAAPAAGLQRSCSWPSALGDG